MNIIAFTSIRSDYDLMSSLFTKLNDDNGIDLTLIVGGAHNSQSFGYTAQDIEADGFNFIQIESLIDGDNDTSRIKSASILMQSSIDLVKYLEPDLILYAGDREEVLVAGMIGGYLNIPTIHLFGGDHAEDGHIDNPVRHAASKLSTYHFVSAELHKKRLISIGESEDRIFNIGSIALDKFIEVPIDTKILSEVSARDVSKPGAILIFHPVEEERVIGSKIIEQTVNELINYGYHVFIGKPNSDHGNVEIRNKLEELSIHDDVSFYGNLPREKFIRLFKACSLIIGNSSAGILESPSIPVASINIGKRQSSRLSADNVIFVNASIKEIRAAIAEVNSDEFRRNLKLTVNPYGDGQSVDKAYELIKTLDFQRNLYKSEDPLKLEVQINE
ncbi:UDP-N-acetylglucosamine 2-epimerase [Oceaniserpentilla sp. 4NH20-0058]|uniref:UDP-N-acetylglucosamine 2-epimerase n=1 Tax=Oceaniserpentilla sp. 4NH20-0058 TaxID=3127660 RepID=UPI00310A477C